MAFNRERIAQFAYRDASPEEFDSFLRDEIVTIVDSNPFFQYCSDPNKPTLSPIVDDVLFHWILATKQFSESLPKSIANLNSHLQNGIAVKETEEVLNQVDKVEEDFRIVGDGHWIKVLEELRSQHPSPSEGETRVALEDMFPNSKKVRSKIIFPEFRVNAMGHSEIEYKLGGLELYSLMYKTRDNLEYAAAPPDAMATFYVMRSTLEPTLKALTHLMSKKTPEGVQVFDHTSASRLYSDQRVVCTSPLDFLASADDFLAGSKLDYFDDGEFYEAAWRDQLQSSRFQLTAAVTGFSNRLQRFWDGMYRIVENNLELDKYP